MASAMDVGMSADLPNIGSGYKQTSYENSFLRKLKCHILGGAYFAIK